MASEMPVGIRKQLADEVAHTSRNNAAIVSPEMSVLGRDVVLVQLESSGVRSDVRARGLPCTAEHVSVALAVTQVGAAVLAAHFEGSGGGNRLAIAGAMKRSGAASRFCEARCPICDDFCALMPASLYVGILQPEYLTPTLNYPPKARHFLMPGDRSGKLRYFSRSGSLYPESC